MTKKTYKRELTEWTIIIIIGLTLYMTGLHTEVIGQLQRIVLATGLVRPSTEETSTSKANYNLRLTNINGQEVHLTDFQGKTIFLNFWATWCPPCIAEMPAIENLYQEMGSEVVFILISLDKDPEKAKKFVLQKEYEAPIYFLKSSLPAAYDPSSIPTTYILSPEGNIVMKQHGMANYDTKGFKEFLLRISQSTVYGQ